VHPGDVVMILGATGSVGLVAVQTAKLRGAGRVVAVGRDHGRLGTAMSAGADAAVALDDPRGLAEAMREEAGGDGPTLVFDVLWGEPVVAALTAAARGARVLNLGQSAGPSASIPSALVRGKDLDLRGYTNFSVPDEVLAALYLELVDHVAGGRVVVSLETSSLDEAPDAWKRLEHGASAKLVVCP
jgi:NADPH2:quinone reductase